MWKKESQFFHRQTRDEDAKELELEFLMCGAQIVMRLIKIIGKKKLKKLLKESEGKILYAVTSEMIDFKEIPKKVGALDYRCLLPPPPVVEIFAEEGLSKDYQYHYLRHLSSQSQLFLINELLYMGMVMGKDIAIMCSLDEDEFGYLDMLGDFIKSIYPIQVVGVKKYLSSKDETSKKKRDQLQDTVEARREKLIRKLHNSYLDPLKIIMRVRGTVKIGKGSVKDYFDERMEKK